MERKLDEMIERQVRLETAQEYRHQEISGRLRRLEDQLLLAQRPPAPAWFSSALFKVPLALMLPVAVFLLMLAITGDLRSALKAAKWAG